MPHGHSEVASLMAMVYLTECMHNLFPENCMTAYSDTAF